MKIKTQKYGVFYKDGKAWRGPVKNEFNTEKEIIDHYGSFKEVKKYHRKALKKKVRVFKQYWKSV